MRLWVLMSCLGVLLLMCQPDPSHAQDWKDLINPVVNKLKGLLKGGIVKFLDFRCRYSVILHKDKSQTYFTAKMWCPRMSRAKGKGKSGTRVKAIMKAMWNFVTFAFQKKLITVRQILVWLRK
ncbi:hypothetical protein OTU49_013396 [Cherax quadricarinatus]|uniref:Uncharacterized protein n=1 Tax=Cherax quadricarinatus TaxID=27406 RepID=A0AAW0VU42_CHEQU